MEQKKESECCLVCNAVKVLVVIGALNWGLVGLFGFDLIAATLGVMTAASRAVYSLVGICGLAMAVCYLKKLCPCCKEDDASSCKK